MILALLCGFGFGRLSRTKINRPLLLCHWNRLNAVSVKTQEGVSVVIASYGGAIFQNSFALRWVTVSIVMLKEHRRRSVAHQIIKTIHVMVNRKPIRGEGSARRILRIARKIQREFVDGRCNLRVVSISSISCGSPIVRKSCKLPRNWSLSRRW